MTSRWKLRYLVSCDFISNQNIWSQLKYKCCPNTRMLCWQIVFAFRIHPEKEGGMWTKFNTEVAQMQNFNLKFANRRSLSQSGGNIQNVLKIWILVLFYSLNWILMQQLEFALCSLDSFVSNDSPYFPNLVVFFKKLNEGRCSQTAFCLSCPVNLLPCFYSHY